MLEDLTDSPQEFLASSGNHAKVLDYFEKHLKKDEGGTLFKELLESCGKLGLYKDLKISLLELVFSRLFYEEIPKSYRDILISELDELSGAQLTTLSETAAKEISSSCNRDFELRDDCVNSLAKLLFLIGERSEILYDNMNGSKYKAKVIHSLCSVKWKPQDVVVIAAIFRATVMSNSELSAVLDKICHYVSSLQPDQVPSLVYQLLHITQNTTDSNSFLINSLQKYYDKNIHSVNDESQCLAIFHSRDTTLLHILQAIKIGHSISIYVVKLIRSNDYRVIHNSFMLFTCLSFTSAKHLKRSIIDGLKTLILKHIEFRYKCSNTGWLSDVGEAFPESFNDTMKDLINKSIRYGGWSFISQGSIDLAFALLDASSKNELFTSKAWKTGTEIITIILCDSPDSAEEIIKELASRVIASQSSMQYSMALQWCIKKGLAVFLENTSTLSTLLDHIPHMTVHSARRVIVSFLPLLKRSRLLRDQLIMIFRKALFSANMSCREIAIVGVLQLIKCFKLNLSSNEPMTALSQSSGSLMTQSIVDIHSGVRLSNESICVELLSVLKRGFSQQADIRAIIYKELCTVILLNPEICSSCLDILYQQAVVNNIKTEVDVTKLIENDKIYEPVGWFLHCVQYSVIKGLELYNKEDKIQSLDRLNQILQNLCKYYSTTEVADLQIEVENSAIHSVTIKSMFEPLMEYCILNGHTSTYKLSVLVDLFTRYNSLKTNDTSIKEPPSKIKKTSKDSPVTPKAHILALSSKAIIALMNITLKEKSITDEDTRKTFASWVLGSMKSRLLEIEQNLKNIGCKENDVVFSELLIFGSILSENCLRTVDHEISHMHVMTDCFLCVHNMIKKYYEDKIKTFITKIENALETSYLACLKSVAKMCMTHVNVYLEKLEENDSVKNIVINYLKLIWFLADLCPFDKRTEIKFIDEWIKHMVKSSSCPQFLQKTVFGLLINIQLKVKSSPGILVELAREVHLKVGDTKGKVVGENEKYVAITKNSGEDVCVILVSHLSSTLDSAELFLSNLQQITNWNANDRETSLNFEASLCQLLAYLANASSELSQTAFPAKSVVHEPLFKLFSRLYSLFGKIAKYFTTGFSGKKNESISTSRFDKLVQIICNNLTKNIYTLISFVEDSKQEVNESTRSKHRATKDSKIIPQLIYNIAEFEKNLMKLNPYSKTDLTQLCKVSTARDFRFNVDVLDMQLD